MSTLAHNHSETWVAPANSVRSAVANAFKSVFSTDSRRKPVECYDDLDVRMLNDIGLTQHIETNTLRHEGRIDALPFEYLVHRL